MRLYDLTTGEPRGVVRGPANAEGAFGLAFHPDGDAIAVVYTPDLLRVHELPRGATTRDVPLDREAYQRITHFQALLRALRAPDPAPLATLAAGFGYSDQAHMCREFKSMAGVIPSHLHGVTSPGPNHLTPEVGSPWIGFRRRG